MRQYDSDADGSLGFDEFLAMVLAGGLWLRGKLAEYQEAFK